MSPERTELLDYQLAEDFTPFEFVAVEAGDGCCPPEWRDKLVIDTVHDGRVIPQPLLDTPAVRRIEHDGTLWQGYIRERDWGANLVAEQLARALGVAGYHRVNVARVVMDFNRFPGCHPSGAQPLDRLAISEPLSTCLDLKQKRFVLERYYDRVSAGMERAIAGKLVKIAIHTYDAHNASRTQRTDVSICSRSNSYQEHKRLPFGLFDPLFPDVLVESSAKRILRDRIALTLEKQGITVEHNFPYCLPDGSIEVRSQVWLFFRELRRRYETEQPDTVGDPAHELVWEMLLNTNLRHCDGEALAGYLHRFRHAPRGREAEFVAAAQAYEAVADYLRQRPTLVDEYRRSPDRASALAIEVRKDLVWAFDGHKPVAPDEERARSVAEKLAGAIATYLRADRVEGI